MTSASRPSVSVVVPFAGELRDAWVTARVMRALDRQPGDELILVDNRGAIGHTPSEIRVVRALEERSPAHARNAGARVAQNDWILFLDSDTVPPPDLLARFFAEPVDVGVGAVAGEIEGIVERPTLAARFGASRNFLSQATHMNNRYKPRAAAANLLVRRRAFTAVGGFTEGVRAAEDTDFTWRLQDAGWTLAFRADAAVGHRYRESLGELRRQWRGYAAGASWLQSRWPGYQPDPAFNRLARILLKKLGIGPGVAVRAVPATRAERAQLSRSERAKFLAVQILLGVEEQVGLRQSNDAR